MRECWAVNSARPIPAAESGRLKARKSEGPGHAMAAPCCVLPGYAVALYLWKFKSVVMTIFLAPADGRLICFHGRTYV